MNDSNILIFGFFLGWVAYDLIKDQVDWYRFKKRMKAERAERLAQPITIRHQPSIIWCKPRNEKDGREAGQAAAKMFNDLSGNAGRMR